MIPYNPCGAIVEWGRFRYDTGCRFFQNSTREDVIRWYPAVEGARVLGFPSAISQLEWDNDGDLPAWHDGVGEVPGSRKKINHMKPVLGASGQHVCGTEDDFSDGAIYTPPMPPIPYRNDGLPECCPGAIGGMVWGGQMPPFPDGGVVWKGAITFPFQAWTSAEDLRLHTNGYGDYPYLRVFWFWSGWPTGPRAWTAFLLNGTAGPWPLWYVGGAAGGTVRVWYGDVAPHTMTLLYSGPADDCWLRNFTVPPVTSEPILFIEVEVPSGIVPNPFSAQVVYP